MPTLTTETTLIPFGVEHVRAVCAGPILPNEIPESDLIFGFRLNALDLTSTHGYRWPFPGNWAEASGPFIPGPDVHGDACPHHVGDGLCIAKTIAGAQSGNGAFGRSLGLLVAYLADDLLHASGDKIRVRRAWVADLFDPVRALTGANLTGANLAGAYLAGANLTGANLTRANLAGANLTGANLTRANLTGASLVRANLAGASLAGANLTGANLTRANLAGATYSQQTLWPTGVDPAARGAIKVD